jgi:hypothetical protein
MPRYPPHLAKENEHVGKCLSCQLWVKGHSRGLEWLGVKEVILEGLLINQGLDVIIGRVSPAVNSSLSPPHVPCPKGKKLKVSHGKL